MSRRLRKLFTGVLNILTWLVFVFAVGVSLVGFLSQAVRTSRRSSFRNNTDVSIITIAYSLVLFVSLAFCLKRRISMFRKLHRLSRGRVALRKGDIPRHVHEFVTQEYSRSCLISFESLPKMRTGRDGAGQALGGAGSAFDVFSSTRFQISMPRLVC